MDFPGLIWVAGDEIATAIGATVTIDAGILSITSKGDNLGSWPLDEVVAESEGESDFMLTVESDRIMFRPEPAEHMSFGRAVAGEGGLGDQIRSLSAGAPPPSVAPTSPRAPDAYQPPGPQMIPTDSCQPPTQKESSSKLGRNLLIALAVILLIGYLGSRWDDRATVRETFDSIGSSLDYSNSPAPVSSSDRVTLNGQGDGGSRSFTLGGGSYTVVTEVGNDCYYSFTLKNPSDDSRVKRVTSMSDRGSSTVNVYGIPAGTFYLDVITGPAPDCPWRQVWTSS